MSVVERKLHAMDLRLPDPAPAVANYVGAVKTGQLVFVAGHGPYQSGEYIYKGKLGRELDTKQGYEAARLVMLNCLASLNAVIGDLDNVSRIVKLLGLVNSDPDFAEQPQVIDGASDLLTELFGAAGKHARSAIGMAALPLGISVEIEMVVEVK